MKRIVSLLTTLLLFSVLALTATAQLPPPRTTQITASYTDKPQWDAYEVDATAGAVTLTLQAPALKRLVMVVKTDSSANAVTVATLGTGATINGSATFTIANQYEGALFLADGGHGSSGFWRIAGKFLTTTSDILNGSITRTDQSAPSGRKSLLTAGVTVATTSTTDVYVIVPETGTLDSVYFSGIDALATDDTNYITFSITNLGQAGAGSTVMLAATAANTSKTTGGTALAANTKRSLTVTATGADLVVTAGDRLRIRVTASGTLANTVTGSVFLLRFAGTT